MGEQNKLHHTITISLLTYSGSIERTSQLFFGKERWENCHRSSVIGSSHYIMEIYFVGRHLVRLTLSFNKTNKIMQTCGISLEIIELEIKATLAFLEKYRNDGYSTAIIEGREIAKNLDIDSTFAEKRHRKKKQLFGYENEDESDHNSEEMKFKTNFFLQLVDRAIESLKDRFTKMHDVVEIFNFLLNQQNLLKESECNSFNSCQKFEEKLGDIDSLEMKDELVRFALLIKENKKTLKTAKDFLNYICMKHLMEVYPNLFIALRVLLTCPLSIAGAERSFSKLKLIKTFNRSTMMDDRLSSLAIISIESDCARSLDYNHVIDVFAAEKARNKSF